MATSATIKIGSIAGESVGVGSKTPKPHAGEINVLSWNWGLAQSASGHSGTTGAGSGKADVKDLTITKLVDCASPTLIAECFKGGNQKVAILNVFKVTGGDEPLLFVKITLGDAKAGNVFISSVHTGDPLPGDQYSETVTLNFSQVKFEYTAQNADHTTGKTTVGEFVIS